MNPHVFNFQPEIQGAGYHGHPEVPAAAASAKALWPFSGFTSASISLEGLGRLPCL